MSINWPTAYVLDSIVKVLPSNPENHLGARIMPIKTSAFHEVRYNEVHQGTGMTTPTKLRGSLKQIAYPKVVEKKFDPAYFREAHKIEEDDILKLRALDGNPNQLMAIEEMVKLGIDNLNIRIENRIEWCRWQALLTGEMSIDENGIKYTAEYGIPAANLARYVSVAWTSPDTAIPMTDLMQAIDWYSGTGYRLGEISMNSVTAKRMATAKDTKTYYKGAGIQEQITMANLVKYWGNFFPGVQLNLYDEGYINNSGTFTKFLPDNKVVFMPAAQPGEIADFVVVPSVNPLTGKVNGPGKFIYAIDKTKIEVPPYYNIVGGVFGAPRILRPDGINVMDVSQTS